MVFNEPTRDPENTERSFLKRYIPQADGSILDIGCGDGRLTWLTARIAGLAMGMDIDIDELRTANSRHPDIFSAKVSFAAAVGEAMPFANDVFNLAIFSWSL